MKALNNVEWLKALNNEIYWRVPGKELPVSIPGGDVRQDCETKRLEKEKKYRISQDLKLKIIIEVAVIGP